MRKSVGVYSEAYRAGVLNLLVIFLCQQRAGYKTLAPPFFHVKPVLKDSCKYIKCFPKINFL